MEEEMVAEVTVGVVVMVVVVVVDIVIAFDETCRHLYSIPI